MTFRARLTLALLVVAAIPLGILGLGVRREMDSRLDAEAERRVRAAQASVVARLTERISADRARLESMAAELAADNRFRIAITPGADRRWLLDWAPAALKSAGFGALFVLDADCRILSAGHFRNGFDREVPAIARAVQVPMKTALWDRPPTAAGGAAVVDVVTPTGTVRALVAVAEFSFRGARYALIGGSALDSATAVGLSSETTVPALVNTPGAIAVRGWVSAAALPYVEEPSDRVGEAGFMLLPDIGPSLALKAGVVRWLLLSLGGALLVAILIATPLGRVIAAPIVELGHRAARAERAAATGELARQVNHDIKNGLTPVRNVLRHLAQAKEPGELASIYADRRGTLESGVAYLDELARNYARLSPPTTRWPADPRPVVMDVARGVSGARVDVRLPETLPRVRADAVVLRRVLDNLVSNAVDALDGRPGWIGIAGEPVSDGTHRRVRFTVSDTGCGMTPDELRRAFSDFYTTKPTGTGLGLTVVRRLLTDVGGSVRAESQPGLGSTFTVEIPIATSGV
jgi:signal transduction histidine kinase